MKLIYIGFAFEHHKNSQGGYHHIKKYLGYDKIINVQKERDFSEGFLKNIFLKILRRLYIFFLGKGTPLSVIKCIYLAVFRKNQVFHFIYAENNYKWLHFFIGKSNKIVCTFHQPASFFIKRPEWIPIFKKIDKIILMTETDVNQFKKWTGKDNVFFIPHGINCNFYTYDKKITKTKSILMVGNWLRDFIFARDVFIELKNKLPDIEINIVSSKKNFYHFKDMEVNLYTNISDIKLKSLYQSTKVAFFPLTQFTANNAVLEAASCGCNIVIVTPDKPNFSYFNESYIEYLSDNKNKVLQKIEDILNLESNTFSELLSEKVEKSFRWETIAEKTKYLLLNF